MLYQATIWLLLACYSVIVLCGQGLHAWIEHGTCCVSDNCEERDLSHKSSCSHASHRCTHHHSHGTKKHFSKARSASQPTKIPAGQVTASGLIQSHSSGSSHDCEHCVVCQHQSLGQIFAFTPPTIQGPVVCESVCSLYQQPAFAPTLRSSAQPRAPPVA